MNIFRSVHQGTVNHRRKRGLVIGLGLVAATALTLTACTPGGSSSSTSSGAPAAAGKANIYVIGGKSDDPFWSAVKRGGEDAAKVVEAAGGTVTFLGPQDYNNLGPDAAKLEQTALTQNPTAVVGPDWVPEAQDDAWKAITSKNIPVFLYNAGGVDAAKNVGALAYIGSDEYTSGVAGGEAMAEAGVKNILCVNTLPGTANIEARCTGIKDGAAKHGSTSSELALSATNFGNPSAITQAIKAALLSDSSIGGVVTIGRTDTTSASQALDQAGLTSKVKLGGFDVGPDDIARIKNNTQLFAIDQQGYLQGYYAVSAAFQYGSYGFLLPQNPLLTGPLLITADNVDLAEAGAAAGVR